MARDRYLDPYREHVAEHGTGFGATLWAARQTQRVRFEVFTQMAFLAGKRVLDAGSGEGDLAVFLISRDIHYASYVGIDGVPEVVAAGTQRNLPDARFLVGDCVAEPRVLSEGDPQVICISGTLNTMSLKQAMTLVANAWSAASETLLFNFLSDRCSSRAMPQIGPARRLDTFRLLDWALTQTPLVSFRQDYMPHGHDATICMRKG